jgi:hypothetical protein
MDWRWKTGTGQNEDRAAEYWCSSEFSEEAIHHFPYLQCQTLLSHLGEGKTMCSIFLLICGHGNLK